MKRNREAWLGPLPRWELIRLARRGQIARARLLVLCFLMIAFVIAPIFWFTRFEPQSLFFQHSLNLSIREVAELSDRLATVMVITLIFAVAAIAPGYSAAAVAEEKDQNTWPSLLSSGISNREMVCGKAIGRLVFMIMAVLGSLPVLFATTIFGGVSLEFLFSGIVLVFSATILAVAVGIHAGCIKPSLRSALLRAYPLVSILITATILGVPCCCPTVFGLLWSFWESIGAPWPMVLSALTIAAIQTVIAAAYLHQAIEVIPFERGNFPEPQKRQPLGLELPKERLVSIPRTHPRAKNAGRLFIREKPILHDGMDPILWKERFIGRQVEPEFTILFNFLPATFSFVILSSVLSYSGGARLWPTIIAHTVFQWMYTSQTAVGLAAAIARERQRSTLDGLRALPIDRTKLLSTKIAVVLERAWGWLIASIVTGFAAFSGFDWQISLSFTCFILAGNILLIGWASWLSVSCVTELKALRSTLPMAITIASVPIMIASFVAPRDLIAYSIWLALAAFVMSLAGFVCWRRTVREFLELN